MHTSNIYIFNFSLTHYLRWIAAHYRNFIWLGFHCLMISTSPLWARPCFPNCAVSTARGKERAALFPARSLQRAPLMRKAPTATLARNHYRGWSTGKKHSDRRKLGLQQENNLCNLIILGFKLKQLSNKGTMSFCGEPNVTWISAVSILSGLNREGSKPARAQNMKMTSILITRLFRVSDPSFITICM